MGACCGRYGGDATGGAVGDAGVARGAPYEGSASGESSAALPPQPSALNISPSPTARHARSILIHGMLVSLELVGMSGNAANALSIAIA